MDNADAKDGKPIGPRVSLKIMMTNMHKTWFNFVSIDDTTGIFRLALSSTMGHVQGINLHQGKLWKPNSDFI